MAKANEKVHEYRMSGAAWLLEIIKREGIEEAEKELAKRRAYSSHLKFQRQRCVNMSRKLNGTR